MTWRSAARYSYPFPIRPLLCSGQSNSACSCHLCASGSPAVSEEQGRNQSSDEVVAMWKEGLSRMMLTPTSSALSSPRSKPGSTMTRLRNAETEPRAFHVPMRVDEACTPFWTSDSIGCALLESSIVAVETHLIHHGWPLRACFEVPPCLRSSYSQGTMLRQCQDIEECVGFQPAEGGQSAIPVEPS